MRRLLERKIVHGRTLVFEQYTEFRHAAFGPKRHRRHAGRMKIPAFGNREIGDGNENLAAQLPVAGIHPMRRNEVGNQRRRAHRGVGIVGNHLARNEFRIPFARLKVEYGDDPVVARPEFQPEGAGRQGVGEFQYGPRSRSCVEQDGLCRIHDPTGVRLFQNQQTAGVVEPLLVEGGSRHGFYRDIRVDGFQPETDFDTRFAFRRQPSGGRFVRTAARQERRPYQQD